MKKVIVVSLLALMVLTAFATTFIGSDCNHHHASSEMTLVVLDTNGVDDVVEYDTIHLNRATRYNPTPAQCDANPFNTADGTYIDPTKLRNEEIRWCALSWDLMDDAYRRKVRNEDWAWRGTIKFGDTIYVESESKPFINGKWVVHDVMNGRYRKSIDFLVHQSNMNPRLGVCKDVKIFKL